MSEWIRVEDELPPHDAEILVAYNEFNGQKKIAAIKVDAKSFYGKLWMDGLGFGGYEWEYDFNWEDVTHWQPLPKPPETQ